MVKGPVCFYICHQCTLVHLKWSVFHMKDKGCLFKIHHFSCRNTLWAVTALWHMRNSGVVAVNESTSHLPIWAFCNKVGTPERYGADFVVNSCWRDKNIRKQSSTCLYWVALISWCAFKFQNCTKKSYYNMTVLTEMPELKETGRVSGEQKVLPGGIIEAPCLLPYRANTVTGLI